MSQEAKQDANPTRKCCDCGIIKQLDTDFYEVTSYTAEGKKRVYKLNKCKACHNNRLKQKREAKKKLAPPKAATISLTQEQIDRIKKGLSKGESLLKISEDLKPLTYYYVRKYCRDHLSQAPAGQTVGAC